MSRRGLTLLEVLLAIALTAVLLSAMFLFYWDILRTREQVIATAAQQRAARLLLDGVSRDLVTCLAGDGVVGAGVKGESTSLRLLCRRVAAFRLPSAEEALGDLEQRVYRHDEAARRLEIGRGVGGDPGEVAFATVSEDVARVRFRYHDGTRWRDDFDSLEADRLPRAVEVAVWFTSTVDPAPAQDADAVTERLTFEADAGFDEDAFLAADLEDERPPDRVRVFAVPDADTEASPNEEPAP